MDLSNSTLAELRHLSPAQLEAWDEAFVAVECYLVALRLRNSLVRAQIINTVLARAFERYKQDSTRVPRVLAIEETLLEISQWTQNVLEEPLEENRLAARGRLALLLADMPIKWQGVFLTPPPLPDEFVEKMRRSYIAAGPHFSELMMLPQPLNLNAFGSGAARVWEKIDREPALKRMSFIVIIFSLLALFWYVMLL